MNDVTKDLSFILRNAIEYIKQLELERQQALEALLMMRDRYSDDNCPACDHADAVVVLDMTTAHAAQHFGVQSVSYVRRCVRMHYPDHNYGLAEHRRREQIKDATKETAT